MIRQSVIATGYLTDAGLRDTFIASMQEATLRTRISDGLAAVVPRHAMGTDASVLIGPSRLAVVGGGVSLH